VIPSAPPKLSILYVGGYTRSGSTLLAYLLGGIDGLHPVGELRELWTKGLVHDNLCSCGARFSACPFWQSVGELAFGGWDRVDVDELAAASEALTTEPRFIPGLLLRAHESRGFALLRRETIRVYRAISDLTGCRVIVDSSKVASYALLVANDQAVRLRVIHLIRDSRGVAFSWAKRGVIKPDIEAGATTMDTYEMGATALRWSYHNAVFGLFGLRRIPRAVMRYEQLVGSSALEIETALRRVDIDIDTAARDALAKGDVSLSDAHTIGGNPMRFGAPRQVVRLDDEWRRALPRGAYRRVTALTWPLLWRYGYVVRQSPRPS